MPAGLTQVRPSEARRKARTDYCLCCDTGTRTKVLRACTRIKKRFVVQGFFLPRIAGLAGSHRLGEAVEAVPIGLKSNRPVHAPRLVSESHPCLIVRGASIRGIFQRRE
jgi:hypothetical protein